ncbi:MAG: FapA family protein [Treponema sp.]|nr:FapA family protein [Treponema sp.]
MVTLEVLREKMKAQLELDKRIHQVEVNADTIDEALADAAVQLNTKVANLEYEIVEKGSDGILGMGKKPWHLLVYQNPSTVKKVTKLASDGLNIDDSSDEAEVIQDRDGMFYVRRFGSDINLKVIPPIGEGYPIELKDVINEIRREDTLDFDENLVKKYVKMGTGGEYAVVGTYKHIKAGDALVFVEAARDEMKAAITVHQPNGSGADASADLIVRSLVSQGIYDQCIDMTRVMEFVDNPVYDMLYDVAFAIKPVDGRDAYIAYNFETDPKNLRAKETESGQINFKELNQIQNVIADQALAVKMLAERGKAGKSIFGRYLEAKNGKDIQIQLGENVRLDRDGVTIKAAIDGEVMLVNGKVCVQPIKYLDAVNNKTGNIKFVGTVIIKGSVAEGYRIEATNIEIGGTVDPSQLIATGNIIVRQGIFGKGKGYIKAGKSLWAKFIEQTTVEVEENVVVNDYILNSNVTAMKNIVVRGKRAQINGGHLMATEEICARYLGASGGGTETIIEVGIDPRAKRRLAELQKLQSDYSIKYNNNELDIQNIEQLKKRLKRVPQEKQNVLTRLIQENKKYAEDLDVINKEIDMIQEHLRDLKAVGKVKIEETVYAGVKIYVRDLLDEIIMDTKNITFSYDKGFPTPRHGPYEPPSITQEDIDGIATT